MIRVLRPRLVAELTESCACCQQANRSLLSAGGVTTGSQNIRTAGAKTASRRNKPRGDELFHPPGHIEGKNLDGGDYIVRVYPLSNNSYEQPTIKIICISLGPRYSKSVYVEQNKLSRWRMPHKLIWWWIVQMDPNAICACLQHLVAAKLPVPSPKCLEILIVQQLISGPECPVPICSPPRLPGRCGSWPFFLSHKQITVGLTAW